MIEARWYDVCENVLKWNAVIGSTKYNNAKVLLNKVFDNS